MRRHRSSSLRCTRIQSRKRRKRELLAHHFHNDSLVPLTVELGVENPLPSAEIQSPGGDRNDDLMMYEQRLEMRVAVSFPGVVMLVAFAKGGELLQPLVNVLDQPGLIVIYINPRSNVHG